MAALTTIAALATITASAFSVGKSLTGGGGSGSAPGAPAAPSAPGTDTKAIGAAIAKRRRAAAGAGGIGSAARPTLLSGASGLTAAAPTERKTLLGH